MIQQGNGRSGGIFDGIEIHIRRAMTDQPVPVKRQTLEYLSGRQSSDQKRLQHGRSTIYLRTFTVTGGYHDIAIPNHEAIHAC